MVASLLCLLINLTFLPFFCLHAGELLAIFTLELNQEVFYPFSPSDRQRSKPASEDIQLQRRGSRVPGEPRAAPILGQAFRHVLKPTPELPFKKWTFSLRSGMSSSSDE
jgi:hypothetical protein